LTRIAPSTAFAAVPTDDLEQGDRINFGVASIIGRLPAAAEALGGLTAALRANGTLPPRLLELVRLRIAFFNQCRSCIAVRYQSAIDDGLDESAVCSLERPSDAENLSAAERSALRFAELFATNHLAIDDAVYDDLRVHFSEDELVCTVPSRWELDASQRPGTSVMIFPKRTARPNAWRPGTPRQWWHRARHIAHRRATTSHSPRLPMVCD
jgi:AhpD family alkylhydroperoxidase